MYQSPIFETCARASRLAAIMFMLVSPAASESRAPAVDSVAATAAGSGIVLTVNGSGFEPGATIWFGGRALETERISETSLRAASPAAYAPGGLAAVRVQNPGGGGSSFEVIEVRGANAVVSAVAAARFLEQATWGPSPESLARVQQVGFERFLEEQFAAPRSDYPEPPEANNQQSMLPAQRRFFTNAIAGPDQLRQRVAFALSQIFVVSAARMNQARQMVPYLRLLHAHAFDNYLSLMREMTLSPTMGRYLDMVNNNKPDPARGIRANENYARELMQLFTIGTVKLNLDGSPVLDDTGRPIATYDQTVIENLSLALTGWTFPPAPGQPPRANNPVNYSGRMVAWEANHDTSEKRLLDGFVLPAGQTAQQDLEGALRHLFEHPNVGPFVARRLIGSLVTSNPGPDYVARVVSVFNSGPNGARGDLKAVVKAILLDPEARYGDTTENPLQFGHLREPVLYVTAMLRAFGARVAEENPLPGRVTQMGQNLFYAPTVFNYFSLLYQIPGVGWELAGPEFEILTPATALARANFADAAIFWRLGPSITIDLVPYVDLAAVHPWWLVEALNRALLYGRMPEEMREKILSALAPVTDAGLRAQTAAYLVAASPLYQVQN